MLQRASASGLTLRSLGGSEGLARVWAPPRFKRVYAAANEESVPYLRPYDIFDYLPIEADRLSALRSPNLDKYRVERGTILQTCSGRNLGPAVMVDDSIAEFALSHDLVRIEVEDETLAHYVLAFLSSASGQELLRRDKSGTVIDHISPAHVSELQIPILDADTREQIASSMRSAVEMLESGRHRLTVALQELEQRLPPLMREADLSEGWTTHRHALQGRLDAAAHDPLVLRVHEELVRIGGERVSELARVHKPGGRYKTVYVEAPFGRPILSGGQLLQYVPINLRQISDIAFKKPAEYEVRTGWILYAADGRAEEGLGLPAVVTRDRDGWLASGHVGRIIPNDDRDSPWLYLALRSAHAQLQIRATASGSVVDSTFENDMANVVLPPRELIANVSEIAEAWREIELSAIHRRDAIDLFDLALQETAGFVEQGTFAESVARVRELLGLRDPEIARGLHATPAELRRWVGGQKPPSADASKRMADWARSAERLARVFPTQELETWLRESIPSLGGERPVDVLLSGDTAAVERVLSELEQPGAI
ncbi:MAG: antitoxin Xre/MbcA/ParS toxin-binding domain-containing protein [Gaiellaceae bacterium]